MDPIQQAIDRHGAQAVYDAASSRIQCNLTALTGVGLTALGHSRASRIQSQAYRQLSATQRAAGHWKEQAVLRGL